MKFGMLIAVLLGTLVNLTIEPEFSAARRAHATLTQFEASTIIGGTADKDCGPVTICSSENDYCTGSTQTRCNDKIIEIKIPGDYRNCIVPDESKTFCFSAAESDCMIEYLCIWVPGIGECGMSATIETTHVAPEFCVAY